MRRFLRSGPSSKVGESALTAPDFRFFFPARKRCAAPQSKMLSHQKKTPSRSFELLKCLFVERRSIMGAWRFGVRRYAPLSPERTVCQSG